MNDRFKFRVWKKAENKMVEGVTYLNPLLLDEEIAPDEAKNYIIMQCVGLKDKNGKLIYEGDIVKYKDEVYGLCIGRIEWDNTHYELQSYTGEKYGWFSHILCFKYIRNIEVIGNIYENKDLLNENS